MPQADSAVEAAIFTFGGMLFSRLINPIIIIWVAVAIALFLYIIFKSFWDRNTSPGREDYKKNLMWPIVGLTIMLSAIGIATFVGNTGNEIFQGPTGAGATNGIREVTRPIEIR
jgi:uncharacterized membrane protein